MAVRITREDNPRCHTRTNEYMLEYVSFNVVITLQIVISGVNTRDKYAHTRTDTYTQTPLVHDTDHQRKHWNNTPLTRRKPHLPTNK